MSRRQPPPQSPDGFTFDLQRFDSTFGGGSGTESNPYKISAVEHLQQLATDVNGGNKYEGVYFKVTEDIDLKYISNFTPIGKNFNPFSGTFDGDGYTISNLTISSEYGYVGFFGQVGSGGTVKNVTLINANVSGDYDVGGLVGTNVGTVTGNTVKGTVSGDYDVGGLVGQNYGEVSGNTAISNVSGTGNNVGGLVGYNMGTVNGNKFYSNAGAINGADDSNNTRYYKLTLQGVSVTGTPTTITDGTNTYYAGEVTLTAKTGYTLSQTSVTVSKDTTISGTLDTNGYYVFKSGNTYTLATADNVATAGYPELEQVYALTLQGVTVTGDSVFTSGGTTYAKGTVTVAAKTGYTIGTGTVDVTQATTISGTLDTNGHYVFKSGNTYALATADNIATAGYPELEQVYELTLPEGVTATGDTVITVGNTTYAVGEVTLTAEDASKLLQNVTVNGESDDDGVFTVTADTKVTADFVSALVFSNGGKSVNVGGKTGNFGAESGVYSITASQENSTVVGNTNNNNVIIAGGGENILTGGGGNDTYKFSAGGGIVTDYGIGATKNSAGQTLSAPLGSDVIKLDGKVSGVYFDRDASSKKDATFTAVITYGTGDDTQIIVLQNINKKPTKYSSDPSKAVYQTNDVAAATLKIWDTSGTKQAVLSAAKLKALFHDDSELSDLSSTVQTQLVKLDGIGELNLPAVDQLNQNMQATFNGGE